MDQGVNRLGCADFRRHLKEIDRRTFVRAGTAVARSPPALGCQARKFSS